MKKIVIWLIVLAIIWWFFLLNSWNKKENEQVAEKQTFLIETKKLADFTGDYILEKTSKIDADSEISLSSETYGKLNTLNVKEWDKVSKWQTLASFLDTSGNITISYKTAKLNLEQAKNSLSTQKINLNKAVFDAELNLEKLQNNYKTLEKNIDENLKQAKNSLENADLWDENSKSNLDLAKLDETIKKLEFDYETTKTSNDESLKSFLENLKKDVDSLKNITEDTTDFWDKLFYITWKYSIDTSFDSYFWAKNSTQKNETKLALEKLILFKKEDLKDINITDINDINKYSSIIEKWYDLNTDFLQKVEKTVNNSISSLGTLSETQLATYSQTINWFQSQVQWANSGFVALKNNINTFLNTYKDREKSIEKQIELTKKDREIMQKSLQTWELNAEIWYNKTKISSDDSLKNMEISIKNAENLLKTAKENRDVSIRTLENNIRQSEIWLEKANIDYSKLHIKSPINGLVSAVNVDLWQTYPSGSKLINIVSDSKNDLSVYMTDLELEKVKVWQEVSVNYRKNSFTGSVFSKSNLADQNLNYKVVISVPEKIKLIWWIATVDFNLQSEKTLIPVSYVEILSSNKWMIKIYEDWKIVKKEISLWKLSWNKIEVDFWDLDKELLLITSEVNNFDSNKDILKLKK